jgi:hypothetical protein
VNTLLADPPAASGTEQPSATAPPPVPPEGAPESSTPGQAAPEAAAHTCAHCGAPLGEGQQWCLQCGGCEPGSLAERPNWRPLTALALTAAVLAAGAAVAAAAALGKHNSAPRPATVALVPATAPTSTTPGVATPGATTPTTPSLPTTPGATNGAGGTGSHSSGKGSSGLLFPPSNAAKPPKIPAPVPTPKSGGGSGSSGEPAGSAGEPAGSGGESGAGTSEKGSGTGTSTGESKSKEGSPASAQPNPILLDTDAATSYNPSSYPPTGFGDPALAIDGEPTTAWTAQVQPSSFPNMAEGLLIDLRSPTKLGSLELATPTRGMTVQVYGANGAKAPALIVDPGWTQLSGSHVLKRKVTHLKLRTEGKAYRRIVVWITKAPPASQGTPQAPGHVALSEVALYPPAS